jgi:ABC-2 type transport system ATP-binding protein
MHKNIGECSKGYKQRVGLAYAMLNDPEILILDEPTSGLDPNQIIEIRNVIKEIGTKKTVILSTHILSEVEATCDRIIIINKGNIIADGKTEAIKNSFKDKKGSAITLVLEGEDYPSLESVIKSIIGVLSVEKKAECGFTTARISASEADNTKSAILAKIVENNWKLHEIKQETQSLEAIFAELTKGE